MIIYRVFIPTILTLTLIFTGFAQTNSELIIKDVLKEIDDASLLINNPEKPADIENAIEKLLKILSNAKANSDSESRKIEAAALKFLGLGYSVKKDYPKALEYYQLEFVQRKSLNDKSAEGKSLYNIALTLQRLNERKKALEYYNLALPLFIELKEKNSEISTLRNIGILLYFSGDYQKALEHYNSVIFYYRETKNQTEEAGMLNLIGLVYNRFPEKRAEALTYFEKGLKIYQELGNKKGEINILNNTANVYSNLNNKFKALESYKQILQAYKEINDKEGELIALSNIGVVYNEIGDNYKALDFQLSALQLSRELNDIHREANSLNSLGLVYSTLGQNYKAIDNHHAALILSKQLGDKNLEAEILNNLGVIYTDLTEYQKSLDSFNQALIIFRNLKLTHYESMVLNSIGVVYSGLKNNTKALDYYEQSLKLEKTAGNTAGIAEVLVNIGGIYSKVNNKQKALEYFLQSLESSKLSGEFNLLDQAIILQNLGSAYLENEKINEAKKHLNQALLFAELSGGKTQKAAILSMFMELWKKTSPQTAIFFGKFSINTYQELRFDIQLIDKNTQRNYLKSIEGVYRDLAELLLKEKRYEEAQQVLSLIKEEEFYRTLQGVDKNLSSGFNQKLLLTPIETELYEKYQQIVKSSKLTDTKTEPENKLFADFLNNAAQIFIGSSKKQENISISSGLVKLRQNLQTYNNFSKKNVAALYTLAGKENFYILMITATKITAGSYPIKQTELTKKIANYRKVLQNTLFDPKPIAQELYNIVFKPIEKEVKSSKADTLMWSLDGNLRYVPMTALYDGLSRKYLVENYRNVLFTDGFYLNSSDQTISKTLWKGFGAGNSEAQQFTFNGQNLTFSALTGVLPELRSIIRQEKEEKGIFPGIRLENKEFTLDNFKRNLGKEFQIIHLASHFYFDHHSPLESFLLLGNKEKLSLSDIQRNPEFFKGIKLLTLSACKTAFGDNDSTGKEIEGMAVLAQRNGAKSILSALWSINDEKTSMVMTDFYKRYKQLNTDKAEALRQTQLKMIHGNRKHSHPFYWSPFILIGDWR